MHGALCRHNQYLVIISPLCEGAAAPKRQEEQVENTRTPGLSLPAKELCAVGI
jgi:hypothetical protein